MRLRKKAQKPLDDSFSDMDNIDNDSTMSGDKDKETDKNKDKAKEGEEEKPKYLSTRKYFHKDEDFYVMDAKTNGNIGRYLNHSCNPNCFVQNCFVDTHDLRLIFSQVTPTFKK